MRQKYTFPFLLAGLLCWLSSTMALQAQTLDPAFQPTVLKTPLQGGVQLSVNTLAVQPDGKVLVGGGFDFVNGTLTGKLQRLNADGSTDASFNPGGTGFNGFIAAVLLQPDGKILVAGGFTTFNNQPRALLVRLNANGTLDPSFTFNAGLNDYRQLASLALQPDGKILVGGGPSFNGQSPGGLLRLNPDGSIDPTFNTGPGGFGSGLARAILVQADGKILVGGSFSTIFNGQSFNNLVRLNPTGSIDATFNVNSSSTPGPSGPVTSLTQQPDGKLLIGGSFRTFDGQPAVMLTRRLLDGRADPTFQLNTNTAGAVSVFSIRVQANGGIIIGGGFTQYNGVARNRVARLDGLGNLDMSFSAGAGANATVNDLALTPAGQVLVGGGFTQYDGSPHTGVARLSTTGQLDHSFAPLIEARGTIIQAVPLPNGQLLAWGNFTQFNGQALSGSNTSIRRINADGTIDQSFTTLATGNIQGLAPDGSFFTLGLIPLVRWTATGARDNSFVGQAFGAPTGFAPGVRGIISQPNNKVLVFGRFSSYGSLTGLSGLIRLNADGTPDNTFTPPSATATRIVTQVLVQPSGKLVVVSEAESTTSSGTAVTRLNANGTLDNTFSVGAGAGPNAFYSVLMQPDGRLLVSGGFTSFNGQAAPYGLTRLTVDGAPDPTFSGLTASYAVFTVQPDGRLLVGRNFANPSRASAELVRLNANGSLDTSFGPVAVPQAIFSGDDILAGVLVQPTQGKIVLYGSFRYVAGQPRIGLARLSNVGLATRPGTAAALPLALYPNPARAAVTVQLPAAAQARPATLLDLGGRPVQRWTVPAGQAEARLPLGQLAAGVYLLQVRGTDAVYQHKVVVTP